MSGEDDNASEYASPACFIHEVDPAYFGLSPVGSLLQHEDVMRWRKSERARLIGERLEISAGARKCNSGRIAEQLDTAIGDLFERIVSAYWPMRASPICGHGSNA